jgi:hypothetical protein
MTGSHAASASENPTGVMDKLVVIRMDDREALEAEFIAEVLRIVGPGADPDEYVVAPDTSDALLEIRVQRLRELPSGIGHDELLRRVGPRNAD